MYTDHIAFLVRSVEATSKCFPNSCTQHQIEEQPAEGTLERYITFGDESFPSVLLMQAVADGPYMRAMNNRGPGIHHIGCECSSFEEVLLSSNIGRLFLHPISMKTILYRTLWLCRPGLPFLIELNQKNDDIRSYRAGPLLKLPNSIPVPGYAGAMFKNLNVESTIDELFQLKINGIEIKLDPDAV